MKYIGYNKKPITFGFFIDDTIYRLFLFFLLETNPNIDRYYEKGGRNLLTILTFGLEMKGEK